MKKNIGATSIHYTDCQNLIPVAQDDYLHHFTLERILSNDTVLLSTETPVHTTHLPGFTWMTDATSKNYVRATVAEAITMRNGNAYIVQFKSRRDIHKDTLIHVVQSLDSAAWRVEKMVLKALSSWRMNFLGKTLINKLYKSYGEQAFLMVMHNPEAVAGTLNLDAKRLMMLKNEVSTLLSNWHKIAFFLLRDLKLTEAEMVVDVLNNVSVSNKKINPFILMHNRNISQSLKARYLSAMGIYGQCNSDLESVIIDYFDALMSKTGETALDMDEAIHAASGELSISKSKVENCIIKMISKGTANYRKLYSRHTISMGRMRELDMQAAESFAARVDDFFEHDKMIEHYEDCARPDGTLFSLADEQKVAIQTAVSSATSIITGGPGTGKTTTIKSLLAELKKLYPEGRIFMAAPTGKAARRMVETTGQSCMTLHRMLGMTPDSSPILSAFSNHDTLILDEASLMDINLLSSAIKHTGSRGRVILIGDPNQISSIDTGDILNDAILSRHVTVAELNDIQRQARDSYIVKAAYQVLAGNVPEFPVSGGDLHYVEANSPTEVQYRIKELVESVIPNKLGIDKSEIQIIAAMRKGEAGVNKINDRLKPIFNPSSQEPGASSRALGNQIYHVGDRIMQLLNRYDLDVQNGEVGTIIEFDEKNKQLRVDFGDRVRTLPYDNYPFMTHSWGMTAHKSQGSEYNVVILSMPSDHQYMLHRRLFFTMLTRAKNHVFVVGSKQTLEITVKDGRINNTEVIANAGNKDRLTHLPFLLSEKICERSNHASIRRMAKASKNIRPPKPVYTICADSIVVPF